MARAPADDGPGISHDGGTRHFRLSRPRLHAVLPGGPGDGGNMAGAGSRRLKAAAVFLALVFAPSPPAEARNEVLHTQWLGLRFEQEGQPARLFMRSLYVTEVRLRPAPFRILLPTHGGGDLYRLTAWSDDSILREAPVGVDLEDPGNDEAAVYFGRGTGIADTEAGSGTLYLNRRGHHYLRGL